MNELNFYESSFQRHKAQEIIDNLKERESDKIPVKIDGRTTIYVKRGTDIEQFIETWKRKTKKL